jgi:hypothetical protein
LRHQQTGQGRAGALSRISSYTNCEFKVDYEKDLLLTTFGFVKRDLNERFWIEMAESASRI